MNGHSRGQKNITSIAYDLNITWLLKDKPYNAKHTADQ
jgi:hypothetical protein